MKIARYGFLAIAVIMLLALAIKAPVVKADFASDVSITQTELDNDALDAVGTNAIMEIDRGQEFPVKVHLENSGNDTYQDMQVEVTIRGSHNDDVSDITDTFDLKGGESVIKRLTLSLPQRLDQSVYRMHVRVDDKDGATVFADYYLDINTARNLLVIKDVILNPADTVKAGRALLATVRVKNYGDKDENDIKVAVNIPELAVSASDYINELKGDTTEESASSEELYLRIPACAKAKDYTMYVEVTYDDGDKVVRTTKPVTVTEGDLCPNTATTPVDGGAKTIISVGTSTQQVTKGQGGAVYPITIINQGASTATYTIGVDSVGDWASFQMSPSNVVTIPASGTATVYVYAAAKSTASAGEQMFSVSISRGGELLQQVPLKATVVGSKVTGWSSLRSALEIALVVLVVLLIIFGLIVGFNKLRKGDEDAEEGGKTYY